MLHFFLCSIQYKHYSPSARGSYQKRVEILIDIKTAVYLLARCPIRSNSSCNTWIAVLKLAKMHTNPAPKASYIKPVVNLTAHFGPYSCSVNIKPNSSKSYSLKLDQYKCDL